MRWVSNSDGLMRDLAPNNAEMLTGNRDHEANEVRSSGRVSALHDVLVAATLVAFAFSGYLKWIPIFPIDPTLLFGLFATYLVAIDAIFLFPARPVHTAAKAMALVLGAILVGASISGSFGPSPGYWVQKLMQLTSVVMAYALTVFWAARGNRLQLLKNVVYLALLLSLAILAKTAMDGTLNVVAGITTTDEIALDYLSLAELMGLIVLLSLGHHGYFTKTIALMAIFMMVILAARGPIIFLILCIWAWWAFIVGRPLRATTGLVVTVVCALSISLYLDLSGVRLVQRLSNLLEFGEAARVDMYLFSFARIAESPLAGIGFGAFGLEYLGQDMRAYPHNWMLELVVEMGLFGFLTGVLFFALASWIILSGFFAEQKWKIPTAFPIAALFLFLNAAKSSSFVDLRLALFFLGCAAVQLCVAKSKRLFLRQSAY